MDNACDACWRIHVWNSISRLERKNRDYVMREQGWSTFDPLRERHSESCQHFCASGDGGKHPLRPQQNNNNKISPRLNTNDGTKCEYTLPMEMWMLVANQLLRDPGQGWPASLWRVRRLLSPAAFASKDSFLCIAFRHTLRKAWKLAPRLMKKLLVRPGPSITKTHAFEDALKHVFMTKKDRRWQGWWWQGVRQECRDGDGATLRVYAITPSKLWCHDPARTFICHISGRAMDSVPASCCGFERLPIYDFGGHPYGFGGGVWIKKTGNTPESKFMIKVKMEVIACTDPFGRPHFKIGFDACRSYGIVRQCERHKNEPPMDLEDVAGILCKVVCRLALLFQGNVEFFVVRRPLGCSALDSRDIFNAATTPHPVSDESAGRISQSVASLVDWDTRFRLTPHVPCEFGARIYCTDEHESPTGCWLVSYVHHGKSMWTMGDNYTHRRPPPPPSSQQQQQQQQKRKRESLGKRQFPRKEAKRG